MPHKPIVIPRQRSAKPPRPHETQDQRISRSIPFLLTSVVVLLSATLPWVRRWILSGAAIESLLLICGASAGSRIFPEVSIWTLLTSLNLIYAVSSTSWLLYGLFTVGCYPSILLTCLFQFSIASDFVRRWLRKILRELHFTKDKIAFFDLPALEIDTDVHGLFVARGVTVSVSSLTIVAHGLELGLKLTDDIELALYVDRVDIQFFRRIVVGAVYGNIKGGESEMTFGDLETVDADDDTIFQSDTPFLRAANGAPDESKPTRPSIPSAMTGGSYIKDSSVREGLGTLATFSPDDAKAEKQYNKMLEHIESTSHVYEARKQASENAGSDDFLPKDEKEMRAAICAKLHEMPSVPNPPSRSIRVTTLQGLSPPHVREFMHRLPALLRLLLMPLSYFHPISISSINAAGSGKWLTALLQERVFKHYSANDAELRRLERKISNWLASAYFCVELTEVFALGRVNLDTAYDVVAHLDFADILAYRTVPQEQIREVARLGGADATFTMPSFLLPHHEHLLPHIATTSELETAETETHEADGKPRQLQSEKALEQMKADETEILMSVHASLPACFDQSLLNFIAALVKATKVIELEKTLDESSTEELPTTSPTDSMDPISPTSTADSVEPITPSSRTATGFKTFAAGIRQNIKDKATGEGIKELARDIHQSTKLGMKKAVVGGMVNDRWIAKIVGKVAAMLEKAQGDIGYSGGIPVPLAPYRAPKDLPSKILP